MARASKACGTPNCPHLKPCPVHGRKPWDGSTRRSRLPPNWSSTIAPRILERDPTCRIRTHCDGAPSTEVDHIAHGDDHRDSNLQGACTVCHRAKTQAEAAEARAANRTR